MSLHPSAKSSRPDDRLWAFCLDVYGQDGVAPACLALQDRHGMDVPLLLFVAWAGAEAGLALSGQQMESAARSASAWQGEVVTVLRGLRRRLKLDLAANPDAAVEALRNDIKRAELAAERIELAALARIAEAWLAQGDVTDAEAAAVHNLAACFRMFAGRNPDAAAAVELETVARAAIARAESASTPAACPTTRRGSSN
ncbi:MAG TPA: TIGR02444 family protein [Caulobacteraceae bacterium]|jgi:uncharacterized protein (TIGR02444 family)|nr:TIGR02444 family protein [Caulobacteraceae bacterium]